MPSLLSYEKHRCHTRDKVNIYQFTTSFCSPDHMYNQGSQRSINSSISLMLLHTEQLLLFSKNPVFVFRSFWRMTLTILKILIRNCICYEVSCLGYLNWNNKTGFLEIRCSAPLSNIKMPLVLPFLGKIRKFTWNVSWNQPRSALQYRVLAKLPWSDDRHDTV